LEQAPEHDQVLPFTQAALLATICERFSSLRKSKLLLSVQLYQSDVQLLGNYQINCKLILAQFPLSGCCVLRHQ